ncbi:MAG: hypothetical protein QXO76_08655, partial [Thermoproteota archaeon]
MVDSIPEEVERKIRQIFCQKIGSKKTARELTEELWRGAVAGGELEGISPEEWFERRVEPQLLWLDRNDYARALRRALWLAPRFATLDFGVRTRAFAQVLTDTARGFL